MAIILDNIEREYLLKLLKDHPNSLWPHQKLIDKVQTDIDRLQEIANCSHIKGQYIGQKECCTKCAAYYEEGMGFSWSLKQSINRQPSLLD